MVPLKNHVSRRFEAVDHFRSRLFIFYSQLAQVVLTTPGLSSSEYPLRQSEVKLKKCLN